MKRYALVGDQCENVDPIEEKDGKWVRYEDVVKLCADHANPIDLEISSVKCNCAEMAGNPDHSYWWICPAHGYKRI